MTILESLLQVTIAGLVLGAGLPILFGVGIRLWVPAADGADGADSSVTHNTGWRRSAAMVIFALIALAILVGLMWVTQGRIYSTFGWDVFGTATTGGGH